MVSDALRIVLQLEGVPCHIAWFIYAHRLSLAGYPFAKLHPRVDAYVQKLRATPEFAKEVTTPPEFDAHLAATRKADLQAGKTLEMVAGF